MPGSRELRAFPCYTFGTDALFKIFVR